MELRAGMFNSIVLTRTWILAFVAFLSLPGCTTAPWGSQEPQGGLESIAILGTNDIHGVFSPLSFTTADTGSPISYEAGGLPMIASHVNVLRSEFGDRFIWLDAGDFLQGTLESNLEQGAPAIEFFNRYHLFATAVGNHEFDFGLDTLNQRIKEAHFPFLAANISSHTPPFAPASDFLSRIRPHQIIQAGNLKVGILGLSTPETPQGTRPHVVASLQFEDLKTTTLREAQALRSQGAHIVLLVAHAGLQCTPGPGTSSPRLRQASDLQGKCGEQNEIVQLLRSLPSGTVDGVISGHTHTLVHHWIAGIPVIQGGAYGRYLNVIYLTYDWKERSILPDETRIEGPIPVCTKVFQNQRDCNGDRLPPKNGRGPLVPPRFHGKTLRPNSDVLTWLASLTQKGEKQKNRVFGTAVRTIEHRTDSESELGNLTADAIRKASGADFSLINPGGIRFSLKSGPLSLASIFKAIPFESEIALLRLTPEELKRLFQASHDGKRGIGSISGFQLRLVDLKIDTSNRLLDVIYPHSKTSGPFFTLATTDFLAMGGDGLRSVISQIPPDRIELNTGKLVRDAVLDYILQSKDLNSTDAPLLDPTHPRLIFGKPPIKNVVNLSNGKGTRQKRGVKRRTGNSVHDGESFQN